MEKWCLILIPFPGLHQLPLGLTLKPRRKLIFVFLLKNKTDSGGQKRDKLFLKNSSHEGMDREAFQDLRLFSGRGKSHHFHSALQLTVPPLHSCIWEGCRQLFL